MVGDPFIQTGRPSTKVFTVADSHKTPESTEAKLHHPARDPERTVDMVPALADQYLLSGNKFPQACYFTICDNQEVNIYDGRTEKIIVSEEAVLKGYFCPKSRMWHIPLQPHISNNNTDTLLLNRLTGTESLSTTYTVTNSACILQHIQTNCDDRPAPDKAIKMCMNSLALSQQSTTSMAPQVSPPRQPGSKTYTKGTTNHVPS